jgi:glycosyltransferase involved in cell wall biosynthesis
MALLALAKDHHVVACLHPDLHAAGTLTEFRKRGGQVVAWRRGRMARLEGFKQKLNPNFTDAKLGSPDLILLSCGSLPAITFVPGLMDYLQNTRAGLSVLCLFNAEALAFSPAERVKVAQILRRSAVNIFVADQNRRQAVRQFGVDLDRAAVFYGPLRERLEMAIPMPPVGSSVVFSCVARLDLLWKGQDILLEVLAADIWREREWTLRLFGTGTDRDHLASLVRHFGLEERVQFAGYIEIMEDIWRDSHVMVLPSRGEGTPLATLEAMMCGRPVVTTDVGGNGEVLEEGKTGWIAEAATPQSFASALERCWQAQDSWSQMGIDAHLKAVEVADSDPSGCLLTILEEVIKHRF